MRLVCVSMLAIATFSIATANESATSIFTDDWIAYMRKVKKCMDEFGYTAEDLAKYSDYSKGNSDDNFKCFQLCQYNAFEVVKDGRLDEDELVKYHDAAGDEKFEKIVLYCGKESEGTDDCDLAYNIEKCIYDKRHSSN